MQGFDKEEALKEIEENKEFLISDGWTVRGNLAYRHLLYLKNSGNSFLETTEQILMQYELNQAETDKIKQELIELISLKQELNKYLSNQKTEE